MSEKRFLVVIETQRVKGYLFASSILRETRGASLLLDKLNCIDTGQVLKNLKKTSVEEIYLGGGSGRILFESKCDAQKFSRTLRSLYQQKTVNARVSVEVVERGKSETFPNWMSRGVRESQKNKLARVEAVPLLGGRWIRPCSSCGTAPAEETPPPDIQGRHSLCGSCSKKRDVVTKFYREIKHNRAAHIPLDKSTLRKDWPNFVLTTLIKAVEERFGVSYQTLTPQDLHQIADVSRPRNYIGFIYADGNRMGETIKAMGDKFPDDEKAKQAYAAFSAITDEATRSAAVQAVLEMETVETREDITPGGEPAHFVPAEFVLAGGDDLVLIVPAHAALRVATRFISLFQKFTKELQDRWQQEGRLHCRFAPDGLTTSAGVVLAHASYPASQLMDFAGELMKLAKRKAADLAKKEKKIEGTLDFMVLHTAGSERIKARRRTEYLRQLNGRTVRLTERPYTAGETDELLQRIRDLKNSGVPRTKLKALYPVLFQGGLQAQFDALRLKERLKVTGAFGQSEPLRKLVADLPFFPFRDNQGTWTTPLSELIELYDFVPLESDSHSSGVTNG